MGLEQPKFTSMSIFFLIPLILSIGLASSITFFDLIQDAEGAIAVGPKAAKSFGSRTSGTVCGDRLCSEDESTGQASASTRINPSTPIPNPIGSTISVDRTNFSLSYSITGGSVLNVNPGEDTNSLIITIETTSDGELAITLPRALIDAKLGNADDVFFVLVDGEEVAFGESKTSTNRTLTISFTRGDETIEIIGTSIVPEFGTIAVMILGIAIISIIAVTARSKVIPRL
jgi:predicted secreted protein with PEFG-CTERM motif